MFKRFILVITTIALLISFVTYQPKQVDAFVNQAVKIAAKQAIRAITKSSVDKTIDNMLVKNVLEEVAEGYAKKNGYKIVESGGQKLLMKETFTAVEKKTLKNKIDEIIDKKIYGDSPGWVKFVDWFIGVGAITLAGEMLSMYLSGDLQQFLAEIINEALVSLGWIQPAVPKDVSVKDPVGWEKISGVPKYDYTGSQPSYNNLSISNTYRYEVSGNYSGDLYFPLALSQPQFIDGSVYYTEVMPISGSGLDRIPYIGHIKTNSGSTEQGEGFFKLSYDNLHLGAGTITVYVDGKLVNTIDNPTSLKVYTLISLFKDNKFSRYKYNRHITQLKSFDPFKKRYISRLILQDTYLKQSPDVYIQLEHKDGTTFSNTTMSRTNTYMIAPDSALMFPYIVNVGYFRDINLALSTDMLPQPTLVTTDIKVPVIDTDGRVPVPQKTLFPDGYTYDPVEQVIKDPSGVVVTEPEKITLPDPDPVIEYTPEGDTVIDGVPTGVPKPPDTTPTDPTKPGGISGGKPSDIDWDKLKAVPATFTKKFPFSLPWDAKRFIDGVLGDVPAAKDIVVKVKDIGGVHIGMNITIPDFFDKFFTFTRVTTLIIFDIGLIFGLYRLLGGAS